MAPQAEIALATAGKVGDGVQGVHPTGGANYKAAKWRRDPRRSDKDGSIRLAASQKTFRSCYEPYQHAAGQNTA